MRVGILRNRDIVIVAKGRGISYSFDATNTKCYYIAKILQSYGLEVTILSGLYLEDVPCAKNIGRHKGVKYFMPSIYLRSNSRIIHFFRKLERIQRVLSFLIYLKLRRNKIHYIFDDNSTPLPFLVILKWLNIVELIFNIEEWPLSHNIPIISKIYSQGFACLSILSSSKIICVSTYLVDQVSKINKRSNVFKLPCLSQFDSCDNIKVESGNCGSFTRFLYCGHVGYEDVILNIINAFIKTYNVYTVPTLELVLILHGDDGRLKKISGVASRAGCPIFIKTFLTDVELQGEYQNASVLLAPLRITLQDMARYPQKIAEYSSISKPIITTRWGDNQNYFEDGVSAIFVNEFSIDELSEKMKYAVDFKHFLPSIAENGNEVGRIYFDYQRYVNSFGQFIETK